ncbi:MAG: tripartite tricarboxylate transporter TctB family protein [Rhodospirillales bacterium]|nr:MAG: tripartite tricarboxylate transporter TctB family protein [Rhodospirillales bacterium]
MTFNRDVAAALGFLAFSIAYGWQATGIDLFPGQEYEPFTPQTFPLALAVAGGVLALLQLVKSLRAQPEAGDSWARYDWTRVGLLLVTMVVYGATFTWLGFIVATTLFLVAGYLILGERRPLVIGAASVGVSVGFWAIMTRLLGLYLAPGELFRGWLW